jgi:ABC-2 type transport system permease protein
VSLRRVWMLARRIVRQVLRDRRTVALIVLVPMLVLFLGSLIFRAEQLVTPLGVVNEDQGLSLPLGKRIALGQAITEELRTSGTFSVTALTREEIDERLRDGTVQGVVSFPPDFSKSVQQSHQAVVDLRLEGANPARSALITGRVTEAAMKALAGLVSLGPGTPAGSSEGPLPISIRATYLFAGADFNTLDFIAPVYVAFLAMFFVFLLACVSFIRERSQGTMERLLATPATRSEIVLGYMVGLGLFALVQVAVIISFTVWVLQIHYLGSLALLFLVVAILALVGISMGILASAFARNEFQVVQFIPLLIIPQALLSGTFWPVEEMPGYLQPFAYAMPLTYVNFALRDVMLKGYGLAEIWPYLVILLGFALGLTMLGALTMRREVV